MHPLTRIAMGMIILLIPATVIGIIQNNRTALMAVVAVFALAFVLAIAGVVRSHRKTG